MLFYHINLGHGEREGAKPGGRAELLGQTGLVLLYSVSPDTSTRALNEDRLTYETGTGGSYYCF